MVSEGLKSNSALTTLNLDCDDKEEYKWKMINDKNDKNEINREPYWSRRSKDDK